MTVHVALEFFASFHGGKDVYAYANNAGDVGNTGWKKMGTWAAQEAGQEAYPTATPDPNDSPTAELYHPDSVLTTYLKNHPRAAALTHQQGQLRFRNADGSQGAVLGSVTHRDPQTGAWVANEPVLSKTNNGWRVDGTVNSLVIKKQGNNQHTVTQTFTDFDTKHSSVFAITVPSLTYDSGFDLHFTQDGLVWNLTVAHSAAFDLTATVPKRQGTKTHTFGVSSSEPLSVDANGQIVGDAHVVFTRAVMIPKTGKPVPCAAWTYSQKSGASFTCDDSGFTDDQLPYVIDPSSQTFTDGGTYLVGTSCCDGDGNPSYTNATVQFNTVGLVPSNNVVFSTACSYLVGGSYYDQQNGWTQFTNYTTYGISCSPAFNNSGMSTVTLQMHGNGGSRTSNSANVSGVTLTVTWGLPVAISPTAVTVSAGGAAQWFTVTVTGLNPNTVSWSLSPNIGSLNSGVYQPPALVDSVQTVTVTATSAADSSKSASATVTINPLPMSVSVSPGSVTLQHNQTQQFTATVTNRINTAVTWSISPTGVGTLSSSGLYTAPSNVATATTLTVTAISVVDNTQRATATITLPASVTISMSPASATLGGSQTMQFTATVGNTTNTAVTWTVNPSVGTVSATGLYSTPPLVSSPQTVTVTATSVADGTRAASATVALYPVSVSIAPASAAINTNQLQQFTPTVNNAYTPALTWSSSPAGVGGVNSSGLYTAPASVASTQTVTITATSVADGSKTATGTVTVSNPPPGTPYQYYLTDNLTSIDPNKWTQYGYPQVGASGLTGNGVLISRVVVPDLTSDYEVRATVNLVNGTSAATLYARASANSWNGGLGGTYYALQMQNPVIDGTGACSANFLFFKVVNNTYTFLSNFPHACRSGMDLRMVVKQNTIMAYIDSPIAITFTDSDIASGYAGVGITGPAGSGITNVRLGALDRVGPPAMTQSSVGISVFSNRVELHWPAAQDNPGGVGVAGYNITRDGNALGTTAAPQFVDETVAAGSSTTYAIAAYDFSGNVGTAVAIPVSIPANTQPDERRVGVRPTGSYWGGAGEQIDLVSGNLNFTLPLVHAQSRGGWGVTFALSYNSQLWRRDAAGIWQPGKDVGYGLGWKLQAGSITPVWYQGLLRYCIFTDATGAEYRLDQNTGGVFTSREGVYLSYDSNSGNLYFPDGSRWAMQAVSAAGEADAGTMYPTSMIDTNGNYATIAYQVGAGSVYANTSARIAQITDSRTAGAMYAFFYDPTQHLASIYNYASTGESYTLTYLTGQTLKEPFTLTAAGTTVLLATVAVTGLGAATTFQYGLGTGEMTQMTTPMGGSLAWTYQSNTYAGPGRTYREVQTRSTPSIDGNPSTWNLTFDSNAYVHGTAKVSDVRAGSQKVWTSQTAAGPLLGLTTAYEEGPAGATALLHKDYTWTQDAAGNVYVGSVVTTQNPAGQVQSKSAQTLDVYGNITQSQVFGYGNLSTPARTYNYTYLTDGNYTSRYIRNRVTQVTVTDAGGTTVLSTTGYDQYNVSPLWAVLKDRPGLTMHDASYGTSLVYRGNATSVVSLGDAKYVGYEISGVAYQWRDGAGHTYTTDPASSTNYALPGVLTPGGNANLATTITYAGSFAVTSVSGPNGATGTTSYDSYGRPAQNTIPDGAQTNYTYTYNPNTQTATLGSGTGARWKKTTLDGFGRVTQVATGHDAVTVSQVDTQYAPCACSALGKLWRVSQPHAPGGTPVWTTYAYDASGRTVSMTAGDGSVTTTSYNGNQTTVTDPAGKWKTSVSDAFGNLVQVIEPNPAGGANLTTNYTYNSVNQLVQVSMPRSNGTQTRTFVYTGMDMTSATNPENGTVTYQYDGSHHVTQRTDNIGQQTRFSYDTYGRLTQVQHWAMWQGVFQEVTPQRVNYYYDSNPYDGAYSQNGWGRLTAVGFLDEANGGAFSYQYGYNPAGRVTNQRMTTPVGGVAKLEATYSWDNQGRMTTLGYPTGAMYGYQFDSMGRLTTMQDITNGNSSVASATYGVAGELLNLSLPIANTTASISENRTYNSLFQLTRITTQTSYPVTTVMDMQYVYTAGQNNGRITQAIDGVANETVNYTYDALSRLATANATNGSWGQAFSYDGFGNLTGKSVTQGTAPTLSVAYDAATNHQVGMSYDGNGNAAVGTYDVENRLVTQTLNGFPMSYTYDPKGKRVVKTNSYDGSKEVNFYGIGGQKLMTVACANGMDGWQCSAGKTNVYFGGKLIGSNGV